MARIVALALQRQLALLQQLLFLLERLLADLNRWWWRWGWRRT